MRILIYGAGTQGSVYGGLLARSGHAVTFLARGSRAAQLRKNGLLLHGLRGSRDIRIAHPVVVDSLRDEEHYDVCLATVRRNQVDDILPTLERSAIPHIVFMHNHADGSDGLIRKIGERRIVIAFPGAGGSVGDDGVVKYALIPEQPTMVGMSPNRDGAMHVARTFRGAGLRVSMVEQPDAWLRRHAVMVGALTGALWRYGCDPDRLVKSFGGVRDFILAVREGYRALDAAHVAPAPLALRAIFSWVPLPLSVAYWCNYLGGDRGELLFAAHARHAAREMRVIADEAGAIMRRTNVETPVFDRLRQAIPMKRNEVAL